MVLSLPVVLGLVHADSGLASLEYRPFHGKCGIEITDGVGVVQPVGIKVILSDNSLIDPVSECPHGIVGMVEGFGKKYLGQITGFGLGNPMLGCGNLRKCGLDSGVLLVGQLYGVGQG